MILKAKGKEYSFTATMKKLVEMNKVFNVKNFRDAFFKAYNDIDFSFLADVLLTLSDSSIEEDTIYEIMESYVNEKNTDYLKLYELVAEEINDKSFFGKKMSEKELKEIKNNPLAGLDIDKIINNTAEKMLGEMAKEEFKGYKG